MRDPAFLFYPSDFLTGCTNLTMEERGQYISMLCIQHQTGHLSEKTIRLSVGNVSVDVLSKFQQDENSLYFNIRLEIEIEKRSQFVDSRRNNGSLGGRPKKPIGLPNAKPSAKPTGKATENLIEDVNVNVIIDNIKDLFDDKYITNESKKLLLKLLKYYSKEEIIKAIKWAKNDSFWNSNFLSLLKLDKTNNENVKYIDVFLAKTNSNVSKTTPTVRNTNTIAPTSGRERDLVMINGKWDYAE